MAGNRDNFTGPTRNALASRAGHKCSFPGCDAPTAGPSDERPTAKANTGTACHISSAAAGPGARRYNPRLSPAERSSYENGIWMCRTHGTLIDEDASRFTTSLLIQWREMAEKKAKIAQALHQFRYDECDLFCHSILMNCENLSHAMVGEAFDDAGLPLFWGKHVSATVRDFVFEMAQNALTHGNATEVKIEFASKSVVMQDNGLRFDPWSLLTSPSSRGGGMSARALKGSVGDRLITSFKPAEGSNTYSLNYIRRQSDITDDTPCHISISTRGKIDINLSEFIGCDVIYCIVAEYASYSWIMNVFGTISGRNIIFVGKNLSPGVIHYLNTFTNCRYIDLDL